MRRRIGLLLGLMTVAGCTSTPTSMNPASSNEKVYIATRSFSIDSIPSLDGWTFQLADSEPVPPHFIYDAPLEVDSVWTIDLLPGQSIVRNVTGLSNTVDGLYSIYELQFEAKLDSKDEAGSASVFTRDGTAQLTAQTFVTDTNWQIDGVSDTVRAGAKDTIQVLLQGGRYSRIFFARYY